MLSKLVYLLCNIGHKHPVKIYHKYLKKCKTYFIMVLNVSEKVAWLKEDIIQVKSIFKAGKSICICLPD